MQLDEKIPNNVDLATDKRLLRALAKWQPNYLQWWHEAGPAVFPDNEIYLRTAISVDTKGWAQFGYVRMPEYRWGIFLAPAEPGRKIGFGDRHDQEAWQEVPGELRTMLRRIIVIQGDTEPASVEQQRLLAATAPSLYDCRNLFQVNVEEGRHLWAMVYLLHGFFGRDGREEAQELLERRSGNADRPRILSTFNEPIDDWLAFYMYTMFTDRDGKYQLLALAESGFDPLARTTRFMLTEEAHHMFVGETGIRRIVQRSCELMNEDPARDARARGGIDLATIQKYLNYWYSSSLDLFGGEISSNAADYFALGLKGRVREPRYEDHVCLDAEYDMEVIEDGELRRRQVPLRNAMNEVLRDEYAKDNQRAVDMWNKIIRKHGVDYELKLPHRRFNRKMGIYAGHRFDPEGNPIRADEVAAGQAQWLPTAEDRAYVRGLMQQVLEPGKMANWIAAPAHGINNQPLDFEYVRRE